MSDCQLTYDPLPLDAIRAQVESPLAGAIVLFVGTTRGETAGRVTAQLSYEAHEQLALAELDRLKAEAISMYGLIACRIIHRLGVVPVQGASIVIAVSSAHRPSAFAAAAWLMDRIKTTVPIWKCEHWQDGEIEWVHPLPPASS